MTARQPTKPQPAKRPVVRVVIEVYPKQTYPRLLKYIEMDNCPGAIEALYLESEDYRRPRVVSVKRVRGGAR